MDLLQEMTSFVGSDASNFYDMCYCFFAQRYKNGESSYFDRQQIKAFDVCASLKDDEVLSIYKKIVNGEASSFVDTDEYLDVFKDEREFLRAYKSSCNSFDSFKSNYESRF